MSAEVSDQVVRMMLQGVEVTVKIAGLATKHLIAYLLALKNGDKKISGKTSVAKIVSQSKNIRIFSVKDEDLSTFKSLAKKYGMLYSVIRDLKLDDGFKDIMIKGEDASKLQRVFDRMGYGDVERSQEQSIVNDTKKKQVSKQEPESQRFKREHANIDMEQVVKDFRAGNRDAMTPENWKAYLAVNSQMYDYSEGNKDRIFEQKPTATSVMSKTRWSELGRYPKSDANGIKIVMPKLVNGKKTGKFVDATVYDISDTFGDDNISSKYAIHLEEGSQRMKTVIYKLKSSSPVPVETNDGLQSNCLYNAEQKKIYMRNNLSDSEAYKGLCRETLHAKAHAKQGVKYDRSKMRFAADSVAYSLAYKYGVDTSGFSFDYISNEVEKVEGRELKQLINPITNAASRNIKETEKTIPKERYDYQPDPVNGLDGKDPSEIQPQNKSELASQMQGKPIATRKNLADDYIKREQTKQETAGKPKKKTKVRKKARGKR